MNNFYLKPKKKSFIIILIPSLLFLLVFGSCVDTKKTAYFNNLQDSVIKFSDKVIPVIHKNDLLSISVTSLNPEASTIFNAPSLPATVTSTATGSTYQTVGYLVNEDGNLVFPVLGTIKAEGLAIKDLANYISKELTDRKLLVDPIITIRFIHFRVTVLGEVGHPTVITVQNDRISILEALGLAGDLTIYGKRDNVLLIREEQGEKIIKRLNLNSSALLTSPFYYLKSNDVVYVEADKDKLRSVSNSRQLLPVFFAALSFLTIIAEIILYKP
jgi:polysaccharide export outer membrane protein